MMTLSLSSASVYNPTIKDPSSHQSRVFSRCSPQLNQLKLQRSSLSYDPFRMSMSKKKGRGFSAVCYSAPMSPGTLQWVSAASTAVLMLARGTTIHKSFLVPLFALQAPASIISWIKGEYGFWTAFLTLLVRLFFFIPGEMELPFMGLLLVIVSPHEFMRLRGTKEGVIFTLVIAAYLAFQHFSRAGSLRKAFDQGSILATLAIICTVAVPCLLLI